MCVDMLRYGVSLPPLWLKTQGMAPFYESTLATIPLGRMGSAEEVAAQAALLISPLGGFTTGTNVVIDGGMTKRIQY